MKSLDDRPFEFLKPGQSPAAASSVPSVSAAVMPTVNDEAPPREFDVIQIAFRHKWLLLIGLIGGLSLGQIAFVKLGPEYNAVAQILVSQRAQVPIKDSLETAWEGRGEHIAIIKSPMLVSKAIEKGELTKLPTLATSKEPIEDILDCLDVKRTAGQDNSFLNVFEIKFRNKQASDARTVVNAIILAYRDYIADSQQEVTSELSKQVHRMNDDLAKQIDDQQRELIEFRKNAPLLWLSAPGDKRQPGDVTNLHQERVVEIEKDRRLNLIRRADINGKIKALQQSIDEGKPREELENLVRLLIATSQPASGQAATGTVNGSSILGTNQADQASSQLLPLLLEEQKLLRDYSDDHPDVSNVRKSIAKVKQFYEARGVALPELLGRDAKEHKVDFIEGYLSFLKQQIDEIDHKDRELTTIYEAESKNVRDVVKFMVEDQARSEVLDRLKSQWNAIVSSVGSLDLTRDNKGYTMKLLAPVREEWSLKRYLKIVGAATAFVLGLCAGLVFLREWRDTTVKSVEDLRKLLSGTSVLGSVPRFDVHSADFDPDVPLQPSLCYFHRPGSAEAESYRSIRTALLVGLDKHQKVIQVTSPEPGDGKSTFVSNLAIAFAQSGKRVLLLDADLRRPTVHRLFHARQEIGTTEVIAGEIQFLNGIQQCLVPNLWLLSSGTNPSNPAETLATERFDRLLRQAREEFDIVLVDTPPMLVVSDPCIVAPRTDGLLLIARTNKNTRVALRQTKSLITQHGIKLLGVIANAVERSANSQYGYGDANSYAEYLQPDRPAMRSIKPQFLFRILRHTSIKAN